MRVVFCFCWWRGVGWGGRVLSWSHSLSQSATTGPTKHKDYGLPWQVSGTPNKKRLFRQCFRVHRMTARQTSSPQNLRAHFLGDDGEEKNGRGAASKCHRQTHSPTLTTRTTTSTGTLGTPKESLARRGPSPLPETRANQTLASLLPASRLRHGFHHDHVHRRALRHAPAAHGTSTAKRRTPPY